MSKSGTAIVSIAGRHGVGLEVTGARGVVEFRREMHRQVALRSVERGPLGVLGIEPGEVEEEVAVDVRRGEEDLAELDPPRVSAFAAIRCSARSSPRLPMLCAITCTFSAPHCAAKSTRKSVISRSLASMLASSAV